MSRPAQPQRIFLVGVPRSGTTLLQTMLFAHEHITSFTESHLFSRPWSFPRGIGPILRENPAQRLHQFLSENGEEAPPAAAWFGPPEPTMMRYRLTRYFLGARTARQLILVLDQLASARGYHSWLEKTPRHLRALPAIERATRDSAATFFIHMIRDGLQTVASLYQASRQWPQSYDLTTCIRRWNSDLRLSARQLHKPNHYVVSYETLTTDPESVLRPLLDRLGLPWQTQLTSRLASASAPIRLPEEDWKHGLKGPLEPSATADQVFDREQQKEIRHALDEALYAKVASHALGLKSDG